ncbi:alpha/beta hydrolase [Phytohabitans sp. ZYX-F-186]|uniref:Alpha/beta hydrolase n=1 Tax=Phytohabitans maris TaxID=3071409 RepID=A0ABU0ZE26_9ACTN|nr:alpha/beta hydrolase [Phytohabitans sp. ZYX-F-186]MDQ7905305.1 alpha/beta hydrolase [Phytohabitans sp. ZYX-F-186]
MIYRSEAGAAEVEKRYRELLSGWPVPNERLTLSTCEGETFVVVSGPPDAPPVVALQGFGANAAMWLHQIERLAESLRVYAVDVIGEPGLSAQTRPSLATDAYTRWLDDVLDGLGLDETAMLAVSLGAWMALDYALRHPERVTRLALLTPSGIGPRKLSMLRALFRLRPFGDKGLRQTVRYALGPGAQDIAEDKVGSFALLIAKHFRPRTERVPTFSDDSLRKIDIPVLAMVGGKDALLDSYEIQRRLNKVMPHATVHMLPTSGHLLPDPTQTLLPFLRAS